MFDGAKLTHGQALLLTTAFILRHRISGLGMKDLIELVNALVPHCLPSSKHYWDKHLPATAGQVDVHYYCKSCMAYLGTLPAEQCPQCGYAVDPAQVSANRDRGALSSRCYVVACRWLSLYGVFVRIDVRSVS